MLTYLIGWQVKKNKNKNKNQKQNQKWDTQNHE